MMAQYLGIKAQYADALLFYRMGDFYELFFDDAEVAAVALDIALTKRGKHLGKDIPMCGVPVHSAEGYLLTLIRKGFRVAVCEQTEDPAEARKRGSKSVVARDVVRLVTPGTLTEEALLDARRNNFLAAFAEIRDEAALAWVDISTGEFRVTPCPRVRLAPELARLAPREVVISDQPDTELAAIVSDAGATPTELARASFDSAGADQRLCALFGVASLDAYGQFTRPEIAAMGAIVDYLDITQKGRLPLLRPPVREAAYQVMQIDAATRRNLEITQSLAGGREGSLIAAIDRTLTAAGGRLLERRLASPSLDLGVIGARHDAVGFAVEHARLTGALREGLRKVPDMDRALSRLALDRGGPRDLTAIRAGLRQAGEIAAMLPQDAPAMLRDGMAALVGHDALVHLLDGALVDEPPLQAREGGFIRAGHDAELDESRQLRDQGRGVIAAMQADYARETDIAALKIRHNNVLGYFIEVTAAHGAKMLAPPLSERFIHRQTMANAVRFTTVDLNAIETKILNAGGRALDIEKRLYDGLKQAVVDQAAQIAQAARALAEIDLICALGDLARAENWARPLVDDSRAFDIRAGRHPVVEAALRRQGGQGFVANDCALADAKTENAAIWLLTGPNMAGKSTFLRQNALIALLAQMGTFVPAEAAHIGLVSQLFSRVGASDDLARGRSTFMVEMVETAAILNQADARALVILDEIGRGTATYDGLSIAWATLEYLHDVNSCRALFATHYHEMTSIGDTLAGVDNATVAVKEWEGEVIFLHEVRKGRADRSYGVQVARLAGLPDAVITRARAILAMLEQGDAANPRKMIDDLPLFAAAAQPAPVKSQVEKKLASVSADELAPLEALQLIYDLKALMTPGSN
ncbi:MAG: DNA mismatch repair protein MutS [Paracoccaceae bacterium]